MKTATLFCLAILAALPVAVLTQPSPPSEGIQLALDYDVRFPLTIAQCEPVLIYYNTTNLGGYIYNVILFSHTSGSSQEVARLIAPVGVGYLEWICNIPAGHGFRVFGFYERFLVVQAGSSSSCLRALTTTYSYARYATTALQSYTSNPPSTATPTSTVLLARSV